MSNKFIDQISGLLAETDTEVKDEFHSGAFESTVYDWDYESVKEFKKQLVENKIVFKLEDNYGGEDQGSDYWSVYSFSNDKEVVFIKFDGWYASYEGSTYEEFYEVQAVEKTITMFEKK